jgi:hypothetical protein
MTAEHKAALAKGRDEGRAIKRYLEALDAHRPRPGRKRTPDSIKKRLAALEAELAEADSLNRLHLLQERRNLQTELEAKSATVDLSSLEDAFVKAAKAYGERKGITYAVWREVGVDAAVLKRANVARGRGQA